MATFLARITAWALTLTLVRAILRYVQARGPALADSVTYRTLFGLSAGVLLGFSLAALFLAGNPVAWQSLIDAVNAAIPGLLDSDDVDGLIDPATITAPAGLTITTAFSIIALIGAAIGAIGSLRAAFRSLAGTLDADVFWVFVLLRNVAVAIVIVVAFAASAVISFFAGAGVGALNEFLGLSPTDPGAIIATRIVSIAIIYALDAAAIALLFRTLSGVNAPATALWTGALWGAVGLSVLQQLSNLFIGGAASNPLLASFATLISLLVWINLSTQVILLAGAYIITLTESAGRTV